MTLVGSGLYWLVFQRPGGEIKKLPKLEEEIKIEAHLQHEPNLNVSLLQGQVGAESPVVEMKFIEIGHSLLDIRSGVGVEYF